MFRCCWFKELLSLVPLMFSILMCMLSIMLWLLACSATLLACCLFLLRKVLKTRAKAAAALVPGDSRNDSSKRNITVGFFHPYCNAGGGGERVLWCAIRAMQARYDFVKCVVYTGDVESCPEEIIQRARSRFNIQLSRHVEFVYLKQRAWVTAERYPVLTLLGQSFGSLILGFEALFKFTPDIYIDTMGYAFTIPVFKYIGMCRVGSYVHYPTISTDMLEKVTQRQADFNNSAVISRSVVLSNTKLIYYHIFALMYGLCGRCNDIVMVNSTWTLNHINSLWKISEKTKIVYPPCDTKSMLEISIDKNETLKSKPRQIISVSQFRPEKNHMLQLEIFKQFLDDLLPQMKVDYQLVLIGSCRGDEDMQRVRDLKAKCKELEIESNVDFQLNVSYENLLGSLTTATVGLHTMKDEHFGIGVVEFMASGLVTLAHDSAGPKMDIVLHWSGKETGFLASSVDGYVQALQHIFLLSSQDRFAICQNARACVQRRFSEETFERNFILETEELI